MRIGIDMDEVLAEYCVPFVEYNNRMYGTNLTLGHFQTYSLAETLGLSEDEADQRRETFEKLSMIDFPVVSGAQEAIARLAKNHELYIITARQYTQEDVTRQWVARHFAGHFQEIFLAPHGPNQSVTKADVCEEQELDIMVDDHFDWVTQCATRGVRAILFDRLWNKDREHEKVVRVYSWQEAVKHIQEYT